MTKISFVSQYIKSGSVPIHLVRCKDLQDRDCYHFLMATFDKVKMLKDHKGDFDLKDYGQVIYSGFGTEPPEDVKKMMKDEYDVDIDELI